MFKKLRKSDRIKGACHHEQNVNRIYTRLKEELERIDEKPNYMTVPAAIRELEKIEMIRGHDQIYRLDHAVTKTQKTILNAFGMDAAYVKHRAQRISEQLKLADDSHPE